MNLTRTHTNGAAFQLSNDSHKAEEQQVGQLGFQTQAAPMSKLTFMASAAILTGLTAPILTLDYFLISMGDYLAALITTSMAVATAWLCLRSLHSNCHAEIRPRVLLPAAIASASSSSSPHRPTEPLAGRAVRTP